VRRSAWIGFDTREAPAYAVARVSLHKYLTQPLQIRGLVLRRLQDEGIYTRPTEKRLGRLYDVLSKRDDYDGQISTEFAISRFLVPYLAKGGWALFMDCDMLVRSNVIRLFEECERHPEFAVMCVKHNHQPEQGTKMDGAAQTRYARKNWSSFVLFNCDHPANSKLTLQMVNTLPGRDLHAFCWLKDKEIGELGPEWNYLVGHTEGVTEPKVVHFTDGYPLFSGFESVEYADEWRSVFYAWADPR
jgi:hypothetical protein